MSAECPDLAIDDLALEARLVAVRLEISSIADQLTLQPTSDVRRPDGWQRRAEDARRHKRREIGLLEAEQERRNQQQRAERRSNAAADLAALQATKAAAAAKHTDATRRATLARTIRQQAHAGLQAAHAVRRAALERRFMLAAGKLLSGEDYAAILSLAKGSENAGT